MRFELERQQPTSHSNSLLRNASNAGSVKSSNDFSWSDSPWNYSLACFSLESFVRNKHKIPVMIEMQDHFTCLAQMICS